MQIGNFPKAFDAVKTTLKSIDGLVQQAGQHFNEGQIERAKELVHQFADEGMKAAQAADEALSAKEESTPPPPPPMLVDSLFAMTDEQKGELKAGDRVQEADGTLYVYDGQKLVPDTTPIIQGQSSDLQGGNLHPITQGAIDSLNAGLAKASPKRSHANPGVVTQMQAMQDKGAEKGDAVQLATSEGDLQTAHTDDGSRSIQDGDKSEGRKLLMVDTPIQRTGLDAGTNDLSAAELAMTEDAGGESHKFTTSIVADAPADAAAVISGVQEVVRPTDGTPVPDPIHAEVVKAHPIDPVQKIADDAAQDAANVTGDTAEAVIETK